MLGTNVLVLWTLSHPVFSYILILIICTPRNHTTAFSS
jgi:hypothetical protein